MGPAGLGTGRSRSGVPEACRLAHPTAPGAAGKVQEAHSLGSHGPRFAEEEGQRVWADLPLGSVCPGRGTTRQQAWRCPRGSQERGCPRGRALPVKVQQPCLRD